MLYRYSFDLCIMGHLRERPCAQHFEDSGVTSQKNEA